jgi:hypothetical protein
MLEAIVVILLLGWLIGFFTFSMGNLVHVLLVIALVVLIVRLAQHRRL